MPVHVWQGILCLTHDIGFIKKMRINTELKTATDDTGRTQEKTKLAQ